MSDRDSMGLENLEARLGDLAAALAFPATPDLAGAVGAKLRSPAGTADMAADALPVRPRPWLVRRSLRRSLLLAAALTLLVVGGVLAVRFGLELLSIEFGAVPTVAPPSPGASVSGSPGEGLRLGRPLTLEEADAEADFELLVPEALGTPDAVFLGDVALRGQVAFVYAPRDGLPASELLGGAGLLITQNAGRPDEGLAQKLLDTGQASVAPVDVDGALGLWITGAPHFFWYLAPDGSHVEDSRRLVGDTLAWERDGVLYRIEGAIDLAHVLDIARSMR